VNIIGIITTCMASILFIRSPLDKIQGMPVELSYIINKFIKPFENTRIERGTPHG